MAISKDILSMIQRSAGKDVALIAEKSEQAASARAELKKAEADFDDKVTMLERRFREGMSTGLQEAAMAGAVGFGVGGGIAYMAHDKVAEYFGKGSWLSLLTVPAAGALILAVTPEVAKDPKSKPGENASTRAGGYGLGLGMVVVGGYLSYQDYSAKA
jgi:hypothetical protein